MFIDRIYRINHTETWNFNAPTLVTSVSHKITAKCGILCPKTLLLTEKQLHAIQFFVVARNVCPLAIPKSCAQNLSIRLLENHSLFRVLLSFISLGVVFLFPARLWISDCTASEWRNDACSHSETSLFIYLFIFFKTFLTTTPSINISYLFSTKLEKNWSRLTSGCGSL